MRFGNLRKKNQRAEVSFNDDDQENNNDNNDLENESKDNNSTSVEMTNTNTTSNNNKAAEKPKTKEVLDTAIEVRADGISALKRTEATMKLAEESGQESMKTLSKNDEVLKRAERVADEMEMRTMDKEIRTMGRRLSRDKCFMCLSFVVVAAIVIAVVMPLVKPFDLFKESTAGPSNYTAPASSNSSGFGEAEYRVDDFFV